MEFSSRELRDLLIAWLALGVAFTLFIEREIRAVLLGQSGSLGLQAVLGVFAMSLLTVGIGFLLHELAHKVVAVRFGQVAEFRADYNMLFIAVVGALAGFLFAAPGAVHHRGRITKRQNGLIAVAGPITNLLLAAVFSALSVAIAFVGNEGFVVRTVSLGLSINLILAGFNMIPYGPLDGRKVLSWSLPVYLVVAVPSVVLGLYAILTWL